MRIAIVDHAASVGGVARFMLGMTQHLAAGHPEDYYVFFGRAETLARDVGYAAIAALPNASVRSIDELDAGLSTPSRERLGEVSGLRRSVIDLVRSNWTIYSIAAWTRSLLLERILRKPAPWYKMALPRNLVAELNEFDVVYFVWPFFLEPICLTKAALVGTFHDLHFKHFPRSYYPERLAVVEEQTPEWLRRCDLVVTSTSFMQTEIESFYPGIVRDRAVVYLAPYGFEESHAGDLDTIQARLGVPKRYVLYSGGRSAHKNIARLVEAMAVLKRRGVFAPLVVTGSGTEVIGNPAAKVARTDPAHHVNEIIRTGGLIPGQDVIGLGYVTNAEVDGLMRGASLVVSASLYEAGCGPALDAWRAGTPVAFSNIPPYVEQLDALGTEAFIFDPLSVDSIADGLETALSDPQEAQAMAARSLEAINRYTWDDVASGYHEAFMRALRNKRGNNG